MSPSSRPRKPKPSAYPVAALLLDLNKQGIRLSLAGDGKIRIRGPRELGTLDAQVRVQVNKSGLLALLAGREAVTRLGAPESLWWGHLEAVAGSGARRSVPRPDAGAEGAPLLPDSWDDPPEAIPETEPLAIDTETTMTLLPWIPGSALISVGFAALGKRWAYPAAARGAIQRYLGLPNRKIFYNCVFDLAWLVWHDFMIAGSIDDPFWTEALAGGVGSKSLKRRSPFRYAVHYPAETPDLAQVLAYNANDAFATAAVYRDAPPEVVAWRGHPIYRMYSRMAPRVTRVSLAGLPLFEERVNTMRAAHEADLAVVDARLQAIAPINWRSPVQVKTVLGESLPLDTTNEDALRKTTHPAAPLLLERRRLDKVLSAYLRPWTGKTRLRGLIKLNATLTGRTAAQGGLQTIPRALRTVFGHPDFEWVSLDFSAAELVVAAVVTECPTLLAWFREGRDPHREAAARLFDKPVAAVPKAERACGKICNFNLLYGGGAGVLMAKAQEQGVELSPERADAMVAGFFTLFPEIRAWQIDVERRVRAGEAIESPLGRRWRIPPASWHLVNQALNAPIQSTVSDLLLLGLDAVWDRIPGQVVNLVHDSCDFLIPKGSFYAETWREIARTIASADPRFPMRVEVAAGPSWGELETRFTQGAAGQGGKGYVTT